MYQELIKRKRFQNRIAESRWSALATGVISLIIWMAAGLMTLKPDYLVAFVCLAMTSVMMGQLNSINALIRIYSRMIMCSFLVITWYSNISLFRHQDGTCKPLLCNLLYISIPLLSRQELTWIYLLRLSCHRTGQRLLGADTILPSGTVGCYVHQHTRTELSEFYCFITWSPDTILVSPGLVCIYVRYASFCGPLYRYSQVWKRRRLHHSHFPSSHYICIHSSDNYHRYDPLCQYSTQGQYQNTNVL